MNYTVHCPRCHGCDFDELNTIETMLEVESWQFDDEGTLVAPQDYGQHEDLGDTIEILDEKPYHCRACDGEWDLEELIVEIDDDEEED